MNHLWYYRHEHQTVGPVPRHAIERYLVLGRLTLDDEVRMEDSAWRKIRSCPEFAPACALLQEGDEAKLASARRFADERNRPRREEAHNPSEEHRRHDRRAAEPQEIREHRTQRANLFEPHKQKSWMGYLMIAFLIAMVALAILFYHPVNPIQIAVPQH